MARLEIVVELLAQPRRDLLHHLRGLDRRAAAAMDRKQHAELREIRFDRRLHVGILQLHGQGSPVMGARPMHLPERGRSRRLALEAREAALPVRPKLRRHAPSHERPSHGRRLALELAELGGIFGRQRLRNGGEQLRHLHDRALEPAKRRGKSRGLTVAVWIEPEQARAGDARRHAADIGADAPIALHAGGQAIAFFVRGHWHQGKVE